MSKKRLSLTANGNIRYQLKTPYRDGTTHVFFEPLDFSAATSIAAGFGAVLHSCRAMQPQSAALDLGEKGVYPSYTHLHLADHLPVAHDHAGTGPPLVPVAAA